MTHFTARFTARFTSSFTALFTSPVTSPIASLSRALPAALCVLMLHAAPALAQLPRAGEQAPGFALPSTTGQQVSLAEHLGKRNIVLFFYVAAFTDT